MSRILVILWLSPTVLFASWLALSSLDWHLGLPFMTREVHDAVFRAYALVLGLEREAVWDLVENVFLFDAAVLATIALWQRVRPLKRLRASRAPEASGTPEASRAQVA